MRSQILIHPEELSEGWIDRMADAGITVLGLHPAGGADAAESLKRMLCLLQEREYRRLLDRAAERGLTVEYEFHAAGYLLDRHLFGEKPEWFRMNAAGERTPDHNFCVSNEEAMNAVALRAAALAKRLYRSGSRFYFWSDDGRDTACFCPACRRYTPSEQQLLFVNRMVRELRKEIPGAQMAYLAYVDTLTPPASVQPEEGVFLEYAPFEKYVSTGDGEGQERIRREEAMIAPLVAFFGEQDAKVLEYWYDNSLFSGWKKPPKRFTPAVEAMECDIARYRSMGFSCISTFGCFLGEDYEELYGKVDITPFSRAVHP